MLHYGIISQRFGSLVKLQSASTTRERSVVLSYRVVPALMSAFLIQCAEAAWLPDAAIRLGMRRLISQRLRQICSGNDQQRAADFLRLVDELSSGPIARQTDKANQQHYEVPTEFFRLSLGKHLKYSCCYWEPDTVELDDAEQNALERTCHNADLHDGQHILELGCGWGSLSLWMAEHYPNSRILAVSNSSSQKAFIDRQARDRNLSNLTVQTCDVNSFDPAFMLDRVVSVEMFEHIRNHRLMMNRIADWLRPDGRLFVHIFCHRQTPYLFEDEGSTSWMAQQFFSGGMMPSADLLIRCQDRLVAELQTTWNGRHYKKTANAWLARMDQRPDAIAGCFRTACSANWKLQRQRWRMFYMACAELFGFDDGQQWFVSHYRFRKAQP
ncbi:MAG: cyclopropane-fatty-acyl-phospholipid synthase family protein [Planctomycetaceae bacterium]